jgi:UDP:flavonoid glycosyltransferase YjiC (YdhE family)
LLSYPEMVSKRRILFCAAGGHGHLQPLLPLARAAAAAGHEIMLSAAPSLGTYVADQGLPFTPSGPDLIPVHSELAVHTLDQERQAIPRHFIGRLAPRRTRDLARLAAGWGAELLVGDEADYGVPVAAEMLNLPHAMVITCGAGGMAPPTLVRLPLEHLRARFSLPPEDGTLMLQRSLKLNPFPPTFRDPADPLNHPVINYRPPHLPSQPTPHTGVQVYVTLGTIFNTESGDLLARITAATASANLTRVIVATGEHVDPADLGVQPPHVTVHRFVAQQRILATCAAVVCHGGSGTVLDALTFGLPMIILPLGADQTLNAARARDLGCAIVLSAERVAPPQITDAVNHILTDTSFREASARLQSELHQQCRITDIIRVLDSQVAPP